MGAATARIVAVPPACVPFRPATLRLVSDPMPLWERRLRAPTLQFLAWSRHAPDRVVIISNESGSDQAYAWDRAAGTRRRVTHEPIGVILATVIGDGGRVAWFRDTSGDESGEWMTMPFEGGEPRPLLAGAGGYVEVYRFDAGHVSLVLDEEVRQVGAKLRFLLRHLKP